MKEQGKLWEHWHIDPFRNHNELHEHSLMNTISKYTFYISTAQFKQIYQMYGCISQFSICSLPSCKMVRLMNKTNIWFFFKKVQNVPFWWFPSLTPWEINCFTVSILKEIIIISCVKHYSLIYWAYCTHTSIKKRNKVVSE